MPGLVKVLVIAAVAVLVIARQFGAREITTERRWWVLPAVLAVVALGEPGTLDAHHRTGSGVLLGAELVIGLAIGAGWAWTTRIWAEPDGAVWSRSTRASLAVWGLGIAVRVGLFALGAALGVYQNSSALMLALAATLLVRSGFLVLRAQSLTATAGPAPAYGDHGVRPARKERV
ncbi:DUF1453 domain-containing protein [Streptomyces sp. YIM S03343]